MKKMIYLLVVAVVLTAIFTSCKKEEDNSGNGNGNGNGGGNGGGNENSLVIEATNVVNGNDISELDFKVNINQRIFGIFNIGTEELNYFRLKPKDL